MFAYSGICTTRRRRLQRPWKRSTKAVGAGVAALARARLIKHIRGEESTSGGACRDDTSRGSRTCTRTRTYVMNVYTLACCIM